MPSKARKTTQPAHEDTSRGYVRRHFTIRTEAIEHLNEVSRITSQPMGAILSDALICYFNDPKTANDPNLQDRREFVRMAYRRLTS